MSTRRPTGEPCPIDEQPLSMDKCRPCPFFRGASYINREYAIVCNWPRNGSTIARAPIPAAFLEAWNEKEES